jgi:hypothetical protein
MECLSILMLSKGLGNDLARYKHACLANALGLEGKMTLCLIMVLN